MNEMRSACLVEIFGIEELAGSTPVSQVRSLEHAFCFSALLNRQDVTSLALTQVIPPGASAGFDIVFWSAAPSLFRRTVKYIINGVHAFKFTAIAETVPLDLGISTEVRQFR